MTTTANVSGGVPVLISDEYWRRNRLSEGCVIALGSPARWRAMAREWSSSFRAFAVYRAVTLVLDEESRPRTRDPYGVQIHPFSIMEYETDNHELFDFVYATADSA